jgi:hypothetical protein
MEYDLVHVGLVEEADVGNPFVQWYCVKNCYFDAEFDPNQAFLFRSAKSGMFYPGTVTLKRKLEEWLDMDQERGERRTNSHRSGKLDICCFFVDTVGNWVVEWIAFKNEAGERNIFHLTDENIAVCLRAMALVEKPQSFISNW